MSSWEFANSKILKHGMLPDINEDSDNVHIKQELKDLLNAYGIQTLRPQVFEIACSAGRFNCSWSNASGRMWQFPEGTVLYSDGVTPIRVSNSQQPDVVIPTGGGIVKLSCAGWVGAYNLIDNNTDSVLLIDLSDLPAISYYLDLGNCLNITGDLSNLPAISYYLSLSGCTNITGDLANLPALSYLLSLSNGENITGNLSDLPVLSYYLSLYKCSNITGAYTQVSGTNVPTYTYLDNTNISATDMDSTLIAYAACTKDNGTFQANGMTRTSASDTAVATLTGRGWTITGLTTV